MYLWKFLETLPEAMQTQCRKCSQLQKDRADKVITYLMKNRQKDFDRLSAKYDPNKYYQKFLEESKSKAKV